MPAPPPPRAAPPPPRPREPGARCGANHSPPGRGGEGAAARTSRHASNPRSPGLLLGPTPRLHSPGSAVPPQPGRRLSPQPPPAPWPRWTLPARRRQLWARPWGGGGASVGPRPPAPPLPAQSQAPPCGARGHVPEPRPHLCCSGPSRGPGPGPGAARAGCFFWLIWKQKNNDKKSMSIAGPHPAPGTADPRPAAVCGAGGGRVGPPAAPCRLGLREKSHIFFS